MDARFTQEQVVRCKALAQEGESLQDVVTRVVDHGLYQLEYRRKRNKVQAAEMKELRHIRKVAQADPELAAKLGIGKRVDLS